MGSPNFSDLGGSSISFLRAGSCGSVATGRKFGYHGADGLGARRSVRILPNAEGEWAKSTIAARIPVIANSIYNSARERGDKWLSHAPVFHFLSILLFLGWGIASRWAVPGARAFLWALSAFFTSGGGIGGNCRRGRNRVGQASVSIRSVSVSPIQFPPPLS